MHPVGIVLAIVAAVFLVLSVLRLFKDIALLRESATRGADAARLVRPSLWDVLFICFAAAAVFGSNPSFWPNRAAHIPAAVVAFVALGLTFMIIPASARVGAAFMMNHTLGSERHPAGGDS
ncbi:MAG: hypothetical protein CVT59_04940 [Actinobacteria bacterium HGW-Actinobacteria-1]|jgi:hypothetical protein|nr:MAG: hypothetical protein CVT59_04940 [Actinobacteria bacterium HGW-Actinobacteria-1]